MNFIFHIVNQLDTPSQINVIWLKRPVKPIVADDPFMSSDAKGSMNNVNAKSTLINLYCLPACNATEGREIVMSPPDVAHLTKK